MNTRQSGRDNEGRSVSTRSSSDEPRSTGPGARSRGTIEVQQVAGNQAVQSTVENDQFGRPDGADEGVSAGSSVGAGTVQSESATESSATEQLCDRCARRYRAGKPLDCAECEAALSGGSGTVQRSVSEAATAPTSGVGQRDGRRSNENQRASGDETRRVRAVESTDTGTPLQRVCSECRERYRAGRSLGCPSCAATLQRSAADGDGPTPDAGVEREVEAARRGGRPLPGDLRSFFEPRFDRDFGGVRVHTGARADRAARAVDATAFTLGSDIVFRSGAYEPGTDTGKRLIAHELTHVVQQGQSPSVSVGRPTVAPADAPAEREADRVADAVVRRQTPGPAGATDGPGFDSPAVDGPTGDFPGVDRRPPERTPNQAGGVIHRKVTVADPSGTPSGGSTGKTNEEVVRQYVEQLCSSFTVKGGEMTPTGSDACAPGSSSGTPESCECLCELHQLETWYGADIEWTIEVDNSSWPHSDPDTNTVYIHSPGSGVDFGGWTGTAGGGTPHRGEVPNWLTLAHELCGHVLPISKGTHPKRGSGKHGGRPHHDFTVKIQNEIAKEHGVPKSELRGLFSDPHHGESLASVTVAQFQYGSSDLTSLPRDQRDQIDLALKFLQSAGVKVDIIGHAGPGGASSGESKSVSRQRARQVKSKLVSAGVDASRILQVKGVGDRDCPASGRMPSCRKVEIYMYVYEGASGSHGP